ncbi:MAG: cation-transporting P-type ATPase [Patescibacteria group bacterium]
MGEQLKHKPYYRMDGGAILAILETSENGLTSQKSAKLLISNGPNKLLQVYRVPLLARYLRQFKDLLVILLIVSAVIAAFLGDSRATIVLVSLVFFNTLIGFLQEFKAEKVMDSLEKLVVSEAKVLRDGQIQLVDATELVIGDIVILEAGDSVPADLRVLSESELQTNDFALTGESNPSRKFTHTIKDEVTLGDRHNLVFMGTTVATGEANGVVIATGMDTELGRIANLSASASTDLSPLQREMGNVAKRVTQGTILLCSILVVIALQADLGVKTAFLFAIGIASSLIPQGLAAEINTSLAQAAGRLAKARALVKKLSAVETLGATNIILTDKTGTLTKNEMTVEELMIGKDTYQISGSGYEANGNVMQHGKKVPQSRLNDMEMFFLAGLFASNARISPPDDDHATWYCVGDPTEGALITLGKKAGFDLQSLETESPELKEFAFDSSRKRMSSVRTFGPHKSLYVFVKGSPESVLAACEDIWDHGHTRKLSEKDIESIKDQHQDWANSARRNLAFAFAPLPKNTNLNSLKMEDIEKNLTYLGLVSMIDPLREDVPEAMKAAASAHIKVSIITGDFAPTAKAIATRAHLTSASQELIVVAGEELRQLDDARVRQLVLDGGVIFSRVSPEDKLRIVELAKQHGNVVAVTGDGINDAPALKRADIGVAMGRTGTDVAKQSAEIVLLDDSFNTLVNAVQQGRTIFQNIKKGTLSCFTSNSAELVVNLVSLAATTLFGLPLALTVMQILAVDLIAELFPIAALGWDKSENDIMQRAPRKISDHILNPKSITDLLWCGLLIGGFAFINYLLFYWRSGIAGADVDTGSTLHMKATAMTYLTIVLCQLFNILQRRSSKGLFTRYQLHNKQLWLAIAFSLFCVANIIHNPVIAPYFGAGPLSAIDWLFALGAAGLFVLIREIQRYADTHHHRDHVVSLFHEKFSTN